MRPLALAAVAFLAVAGAGNAQTLQPMPPPTLPPDGARSAHGVLLRPDPTLTPGVVDPTVTLAQICQDGFSKTRRHTSAKLKAAIYAEYGIDRKKVHAEVDHRVPLLIGGADVKANLSIQDYDTDYGAHQKDHLEVFVRERICRGVMTPAEGQAVFLGDWIAAFDKYIRDPQTSLGIAPTP